MGYQAQKINAALDTRQEKKQKQRGGVVGEGEGDSDSDSDSSRVEKTCLGNRDRLAVAVE